MRADVEDLAEACRVVADGVVVDHTTSLDRAAGAIWTSYRVRVVSVLVGDAATQIVVRVRVAGRERRMVD